MTLHRRSLLAASASLAAGFAATGAQAQVAADDPRLAERSVGRPDAPMVVQEFFSLTCSHCGDFARNTYPRVKAELIDSGRVRFVYRDFPLDQLALAAACAARALPVDRYEGFVSALFANQDRWAFARGIDNVGEVAKIAALAGMSRADFDAAVNDRNLQRAIMEMRQQGEKEFNVNSTPTFVFNGKSVPGEIPFERFAELVKQATPG